MVNCSDYETDRTGKVYFLVIIPLKVGRWYLKGKKSTMGNDR